MKSFKSRQDLLSFLHFLSVRKKDYHNRNFLYVKISTDFTQLKMDEVLQSINYYFQNRDAALITFEQDNCLLVFVPNLDNLALPLLEKAIYDAFPRESINLIQGSMNGSGLNQLYKIISPYIGPDDWPAHIELQRAVRLANCIMIMDDDAMVLKQMEHALSGFGTVVSLQNPKDFLDLYRKHAPDIVFLDIHLPNARGTNLLEELITTIDPEAHVIMISSDTMQETVMESKAKGTKGFIMKPLSRDNMYAHVMRAPTFLPKRFTT